MDNTTNEINTINRNKLKNKFKKLNIDFLDAKEYSDKCPFDFIINQVLTVLIISNIKDVKKIQLEIDERAIALNELIGCIFFRDKTDINNYYIILTKDIKHDLKKIFSDIQNNKDKYAKYLNNYDDFIGLNFIRIRNRTNSTNYFDSDELLTILKDKIKSLGRTPKATEIRKPSFQVYYKRFGSLNNALEVVGCMPTRYRTSDKALERKRLIKTLQDKCKELGRPPNSMEIKDSNTMIHYFGSWRQVLSEAGILNHKIVLKRKKYSIDKYMDVIDLATENNISPSMLEDMIRDTIIYKD